MAKNTKTNFFVDDCFCATFDVDPYIFKLKRNKYTKFVRGIYAVL